MQTPHHPQSGRSMVEMLGVLAIIGVLSAGAIGGYNYAMNRHRANEILKGVSARAMTASMEKTQTHTLTLAGHADNINGYAVGKETAPGGDNARFAITVSGVPEAICDLVLRDGPENALYVYGGDGTVTGCSDGDNTLAFIFNDNLSTTLKANDYNGNEDGCTGAGYTLCADDTCRADCCAGVATSACLTCATDGTIGKPGSEIACDYDEDGVADDGQCNGDGFCEEINLCEDFDTHFGCQSCNQGVISYAKAGDYCRDLYDDADSVCNGNGGCCSPDGSDGENCCQLLGYHWYDNRCCEPGSEGGWKGTFCCEEKGWDTVTAPEGVSPNECCSNRILQDCCECGGYRWDSENEICCTTTDWNDTIPLLLQCTEAGGLANLPGSESMCRCESGKVWVTGVGCTPEVPACSGWLDGDGHCCHLGSESPACCDAIDGIYVNGACIGG